MNEDRLKEIEALVAPRETVARLPAELRAGGVRVDEPVAPEFRTCERCEMPQGDYRSVAPTPVETDDVRHDAWSAYLSRWSLAYPCRLALKCQKQFIALDGAKEHVKAMTTAAAPGRALDEAAMHDLASALAGANPYYLRIQFLYPDEKDSRDGASPVPGVEDRLGLWPPSRLPDENTPRWIRANVQYHLGHELDEHLLFDNNKVFDPHRKSAHTCESCLSAELAREAVLELTAEIRRLRGPDDAAWLAANGPIDDALLDAHVAWCERTGHVATAAAHRELRQARAARARLEKWAVELASNPAGKFLADEVLRRLEGP